MTRTNAGQGRIGIALVTVCLTLLLAQAAAGAMRAGLGVYGVYGIPVVQEDVGAGPYFGVKAKANLLGPLGAELFYCSFQEGDIDQKLSGRDITIPFKGGTQSFFGVNAVLGGPGAAGFGIYLTGGAGSYSLTRDHRADQSGLGFDGGLGAEFRSAAGIAVDLSGRLYAFPLEDGGSRKYLGIQAGINYYFLR
jgi:hypothetical protein